jgi:hypothetical protein
MEYGLHLMQKKNQRIKQKKQVMQINVLSGIEPKEGIGVLSVPSDRRVGGARHKLNHVSYAIAREALKKLFQYNVFGLASAIFGGWKRSPELMTKWKYVWWNLGGNDWQTLFDKVNYGKFKKPRLMKLAPKAIKAMYAKAGKRIGSATFSDAPIGFTGAEIAAAAAQIGAILVAIGGLFGKTLEEGVNDVDFTDAYDGEDSTNPNNNPPTATNTSSIGVMLPVLIGVGLLLYTSGGSSKNSSTKLLS